MLAGCAGKLHRTAVVATVDKRAISEQELDSYERYAVAFDGLAYPDSAEATCKPHSRSAACRRLRQQVLARLIQEQVVDDYARAHHVALTVRDRKRVQAEMARMQWAGSVTAPLFQRTDVSRGLIQSVLEDQVLVQYVEEQVAGSRAHSGVELHLRRYTVPIPVGANQDEAYRSTVAIATGGAVPDGANVREQWVAPFRLHGEMGRALQGAKRGEYAGPFHHGNAYVLLQVLARKVHRYATPARTELTARYFRAWLSGALAAAHPRCLDAHGRLAACPANIMNPA